MKYLIRFLSLALLVFTAVAAYAQEDVPEYTVQIGNFVNPKPSDFTQLQSLGFVYATKRPSNYTDVFIGGYGTETEANKIVESLKSKGYDNAFVSRLNIEGGQSVTIIQLTTKRAGDKINWEELSQAGPLHVLLNGNQVKIVTGIFPDVATAKAQLGRIQQLGFKDAFVKNVNNALLHEVTEFENGGAAKKPLIPLDFTEKPAESQPLADARKADVPVSYEDVTIIAPQKTGDELTAKGVEPPATKSAPAVASKSAPAPPASVISFSPNVPGIRAGVKRTSAIELQKVLKAEGAYKGSLDGYYGKGTKAAFDQAYNDNRQIQKYRLLAKYASQPSGDASKGSVQYFINNLWDDPKTALDGLEASKAPIAKAYRAYFLFVRDGASRDVNTLMSEALKAAFSGKKANIPNFDPNATYAYYDIDQLLQHLSYTHQASPDQPSAPCWLFRKHPGPALKAFVTASGSGQLKLQNCGGFWEWEEVKVLSVMAHDLCAQSQCSEAKAAEAQQELARLYLAPKALSDDERKALEAWNANVWKGIDAWASRDPMLAELATAMKISYFHTEVLFEDFFMDEGFNEKEAKTLGIAALKALVGHHFDRFI
jgi:hypothetical protein